MDYDPISVALKFGFIVVLYLFVLWIARSALRDLRRTVAPAPDATSEQALEFRGEVHRVAGTDIVEGLDPVPVAHEVQLWLPAAAPSVV